VRAALQAVEQQRLEALAERAAAVGALEDALQQPLAGPRPDPRLGAAPGTDLP